MLTNLNLREVYDSSDCDIVRDLQVPLLSNSTSYMRGVGFFTSGWLRIAAQGLQNLVQNGGTGQIVVSPILEEEDWKAFSLASDASKNELLLLSLRKGVDELASSLERDTINTLAWLIADDLLEFRFAVQRNRELGDYHDKVGVFSDSAGNTVAIHGSFNDSVKATMNGEAFSVFRSWIEGQVPFIDQHKKRLCNLWNVGNSQFRIFRLPEAIKSEIVKLRNSRLAPYEVGQSSNAQPLIGCTSSNSEVRLRPYQLDAISSWARNDYRGIFEMATGTGKTITAMKAAADLVLSNKVNLVIILVPYLHLMEQWAGEARRSGFKPILCSGENKDWAKEVKNALSGLKLNISHSACVIAVHKTASTEKFKEVFERVKIDKTMLIGDEAHGLGSRHLRSALLDVAGKRLGLSATPERWFDDEGTRVLTSYFGEVCFELSLENAIGTFLTPYNYNPIIVELTTEEQTEFKSLTKQITAMLLSQRPDREERLKALLLRRSRIQARASRKIPLMVSLLNRLIDKNGGSAEGLSDILIYAPSGEHKEYLKVVSDLGFRCHEFVHSVSLNERKILLDQFANGEIQVLVAVRCLDEGVDVPSTKIAIILASSTNPREFVQRRGRILRKSQRKDFATIYDFIVVGQGAKELRCDEVMKSLLKREMPRFAEFSSASKNHFEARSLVRPLLDQCEMLDLMDKKAWEVYKELKESDWEIENGE